MPPGALRGLLAMRIAYPFGRRPSRRNELRPLFPLFLFFSLFLCEFSTQVCCPSFFSVSFQQLSIVALSHLELPSLAACHWAIPPSRLLARHGPWLSEQAGQ